jgi:hypothetical protein
MTPRECKKLKFGDRIVLNTGAEATVAILAQPNGLRIEALVKYDTGECRWKRPGQIKGKIFPAVNGAEVAA